MCFLNKNAISMKNSIYFTNSNEMDEIGYSVGPRIT